MLNIAKSVSKISQLPPFKKDIEHPTDSHHHEVSGDVLRSISPQELDRHDKEQYISKDKKM